MKKSKWGKGSLGNEDERTNEKTAVSRISSQIFENYTQGYELLVTSYWLLVAGYWVLVWKWR